MINKIISISVFVAVFYVLPLVFEPELIFTPQIGILVCSCALLFLTQPPLKLTESKNDYERDRNSIWMILLASALTQLLIVIEWAYFQNNIDRFSIAIIGLSIAASGIVFRVWCIKTLGKSFTATVKTQTNQKIIKKGPYKYIRHPSYLGAYLAIVGGAIFMQTPISLTLSIIIMFLAYRYRIKHEEIALIETFGNEYEEYRTKTNKLLPLIY